MRISDKIQAAIDAKETFFSFEYFPPRTEEVRRREVEGEREEKEFAMIEASIGFFF